MHKLVLLTALTCSLCLLVVSCEATTETSPVASATAKEAGSIKFDHNDWPWWRGPTLDGIAVGTQDIPLEWSETKNVLWKQPLPGKGHGTVTIVGDRIYLATADEKRGAQMVLCLNRETGKQVWSKDVHTGGLKVEGNRKSSLASSTVACDGERLFISFLNGGAVHTSALSLSGELIWQKKISDYAVHQGYGASPALYGPLVIVAADNKGGGAIVGLKRANGDEVWRVERPDKPNYVSPLVRKVYSKDQLLMFGCELVSSFDPLTGKKNWEREGATTESVTTAVTNGELIYTSGGYPRNHVEAVRADGSKEIVWSNGTRIYVPSMIVQGQYLYGIADAGIAHCWNAKTGESMWKGRVRGVYTASPTIVGDYLFATNEVGKTYVLQASPKEFKIVRENELEKGEIYATPVFCRDRIYMRVARERGEERKETLYCFAKK